MRGAAAGWLERWLLCVAALHLVVGATMPWWLDSPLGRAYLDLLLRSGDAPGSDPPTALVRWLVVLLGAMIAGWGVLMGGLVRLAFAWRSAQPLRVLVAALVLWAALDMGWSAARGVWLHLALDGAALVAIVPAALVAARRMRAD